MSCVLLPASSSPAGQLVLGHSAALSADSKDVFLPAAIHILKAWLTPTCETHRHYQPLVHSFYPKMFILKRRET